MTIEKRIVNDIRLGDVLEENIFREGDGLLIIPKGTALKEKEFDFLKMLNIKEVEMSSFSYGREFLESETFEIISDTLKESGFWSEGETKKIKKELLKKFKKHSAILPLFTTMRQVDHYSFASSVNIAVIIGHLMYEGKISKGLIEFIFLALVHDIGKIKVSKITTQKKELNENEFREIRNHPLHSYEILEKMGFPRKDIIFVEQTHEKWDGTGYPYAMEGDEIQSFAQLIGIVEMYNAMLSPRPHRAPFHLLDVLAKIKAEENLAFGKQYINIFEEEFRPYKVNTYVELNNGMIGRIDKINEEIPFFPILTLFSESTGEELQQVNLYREKELRIVKRLAEYE